MSSPVPGPSPVLRFKRGAFSNLPGLKAGEPGFTTDKYDLYVGLTSSLADNKFFGSGRYWSREDGTTSLGLKLVDKDGSNNIEFKSPNTLSGVTTYTFPETPQAGYVLSTNADGVLSWTDQIDTLSVSNFETNVAFTSTTDNTLGEVDTGAVQISGGVGIAKNLTVGAGASIGGDLKVSGVSTFQGNVDLGDNDRLRFGDDQDLQIYHDGSNSWIRDLGTGRLLLTTDGTAIDFKTNSSSEFMARFLQNDAVKLYYDSSKKFETTSSGINVTGHTETDTLNVSGVSTCGDLTVSGDLTVNGNTTFVNTNTLTVEDRTIELGMVDGAAPSSATTWDLGVLFNYNSSGAKKAAVAWEHNDGRFKFASEVTDGGGSGVSNPQITFTEFAPIEVSALWVNDCAGQSQVINCSGTERTLENITIDAGTY